MSASSRTAGPDGRKPRHTPSRLVPWLAKARFTRAAIQGAAYSNSYNGWHALATGYKTEAVSYDTLQQAFTALSEGKVDVAYIPVANTIAQQVPDVMRLMREHNVFIIDEAIRQINHCVVGIPGTDLSKVQTVRSHKVALGQCEGWLKERENLTRVEWYDTAGAAFDVAQEKNSAIVAIAPEETEQAFGLEILARNIQDVNPNQTRFCVFAREMFDYSAYDANPHRTALLVQLKNTGGGAHTNDAHLTLAFAAAGHPVVERHGYISSYFRVPSVYYEVRAKPDNALANALRENAHLITRYKIIGSFPEAPRI